jgi:hypothetical protein
MAGYTSQRILFSVKNKSAVRVNLIGAAAKPYSNFVFYFTVFKKLGFQQI